VRYFDESSLSISALQAAMETAWRKLHPDKDKFSFNYHDRFSVTGKDYLELTPQVAKDLSKINFDCENWIDSPKHTNHPLKNVLGFTTLSGSGFTFFGFLCGGDWELPVFSILYLYQNKLRGYTPTGGNTWNLKTKEAYGNSPPDDLVDIQKRYGVTIEDVESFEVPDAEKLIIEDIKKHIALKEISKNPVKSRKEDLAQRIESLKFYAPGDEAEELFVATCSLCYQMYDSGDQEKAEILYEWAKEQANASKKWIDENEPENSDDFIYGNFGY
jgi:hypothetical protein